MIDAFISYSSKEMKVAKRICDLLEKKGIICWMAPRDIMCGSHWAGSIAQALRNAKTMILIFSKNANESENVMREVAIASNYKISISTVKIDSTIPSDNMEYFLAISQWLDASKLSYKRAIEELAVTIHPDITANLMSKDIGYYSRTDSMGTKELDIYNHEMDLIDTALRSEAHSKGLWHKTFHCWFISYEEDKPYIWVQKRSNSKFDFPGLYDITVARHLVKGESDREGINQIDKELGIDVDFENVMYMGVRQYAEKRGSFYNREFNSIYLYNSPYDFNDFDLNLDEASGIVKIHVEDGLNLFKGKVAEISSVGCFFEKGKKKISKINITAEDFVPRVDDYYIKIFTLSKDYFAGVSNLSI